MGYYDENRDSWTIEFPVNKLIQILEQRVREKEDVVSAYDAVMANKPVSKKRLGWFGDLLGLNKNTSGIFGSWQEEYDESYKAYAASDHLVSYRNWLRFLKAMPTTTATTPTVPLNMKDVVFFELTDVDLELRWNRLDLAGSV